MRTLCVFTIAMALLAGSAIGVAGQTEEGTANPSEFTHVTGTLEIRSWSIGNVSVDGDVVQMRNGFLTVLHKTSDPRVSGAWAGPWNADGLIGTDHGPIWGASRLEHAEGTWECDYSGVMFGSGSASTNWCVGQGGYEGLTYYSHGSAVDHLGTGEGVIFEGDRPPPP